MIYIGAQLSWRSEFNGLESSIYSLFHCPQMTVIIPRTIPIFGFLCIPSLSSAVSAEFHVNLDIKLNPSTGLYIHTHTFIYITMKMEEFVF